MEGYQSLADVSTRGRSSNKPQCHPTDTPLCLPAIPQAKGHALIHAKTSALLFEAHSQYGKAVWVATGDLLA